MTLTTKAKPLLTQRDGNHRAKENDRYADRDPIPTLQRYTCAAQR